MSIAGLYDVSTGTPSQWPDVATGTVAGLIAAAVFKNSLWTPGSILATIAAAGVGFLLAYWARRQLLLPRTSVELASAEASQLARSIQKAEHASYAISSDWIDLWRSDAFTYYLSLDQASSLAIYTRKRHSPLAGLTDEFSHRDDFLEYCKSLMALVAAGTPPVEEHRMRILIYPRRVYDTHKDRVIGLLRLHSVGRIPCIPLVSEDLESALSQADRSTIHQLTTGQLKQGLEDKIPPQPAHRRGMVKRAANARDTVVFPDLLLIDPREIATSQLWWYNETNVCHVDGTQNNTSINAAEEVFRILCSKGAGAIWPNFTAETIGNIPIVTDTTTPTAELFFALGYYRKWLSWISTNATSDPDARTLSDWLAGEAAALERFAGSAPEGNGEVRVLDVGCGFGRHLFDMADRVPTLTALGVDVVPSVAAEAARDARIRHLDSRLYFCQDDATSLETGGDAEFDMAICMTNTLGNMRDDSAALALGSIFRCLKGGGRLLVSVYSPQSVSPRFRSYRSVKLHVQQQGTRIIASEGLESAYFDSSQLRQLLADNGFRVVKVERVGAIGLAAEAVKVA